MKTPDLHDRFLDALKNRFLPKEINRQVAGMLGLSRDAVYRRLSGQALFTPYEIGILCQKLGISPDRLLHKGNEDIVWMPLVLVLPRSARSMDELFDNIDFNLEAAEKITAHKGGWSELGGVYNSLPLEFYIHSPVLSKFMFFKWGRNFIGSKEFDDYPGWEMPERLSGMAARVKSCYAFDSISYIWDAALIWSLARELDKFHRMGVISTSGMQEIRDALKELLSTLENTLDGTGVTSVTGRGETTFYISNIDIGFTNYYFHSDGCHLVTFLNNYSFSTIDNNPDSFNKLREWTDSFRKLSKQISGSGGVERKLFFDSQYEIIEQILG